MTAKKFRFKSRGFTPRDQVSPITDAVPIPHNPTAQPRVYPFGEMKVGDSFTCPADRHDTMRISRWKFMKAFPGTKFVTRREGDLLRTWRIS